MYAIIDTETTGGNPSSSRIIEIAVILHDGKSEIERFESLVNPGENIPPYISRLTGIYDHMVMDAPGFEDIAPRIQSMLAGNIFVAHNVGFDYNMIRGEFRNLGFNFNSRRICTWRVGRKVFPGLKSYSLQNLSGHLGIHNNSPHRAMGDAMAATEILKLILENDKDGLTERYLKNSDKELTLPPELLNFNPDDLPSTPGIYYFHDRKGKVIYVGKASDLKKRVRSHFYAGSATRGRYSFVNSIQKVTYRECDDPKLAPVIEAAEIRRLWPKYNVAQKGFVPRFGLVDYLDGYGFRRLGIKKTGPSSEAHMIFTTLHEARNFISRLAYDSQLCPDLCGTGICDTEHVSCGHKDDVAIYNSQVCSALEQVKEMKETFIYLFKGNAPDHFRYLLVDDGIFAGVGEFTGEPAKLRIKRLRAAIEPMADAPEIRSMIRSYIEQDPARKIQF